MHYSNELDRKIIAFRFERRMENGGKGFTKSEGGKGKVEREKGLTKKG